MKKLFFALSFIATLTCTLSAQVIDDIKIVYEITDISAEDPNMAMQLEMLKGSRTIVSLKKNKTAMNMDMMGGMIKMNSVTDPDADNMDMTIDAMGQKYWISAKPSDDKKDPKKAAVLESAKVIYDKTKTKKIAGYDCYAMTIMAGEEAVVTGYITPSIKGSAGMIQGFQGISLEGCPLEVVTGNANMKITMLAKEVSKTVPDDVFSVKTDGFKKITMEEFQKSMGGFGF
jgi:hypothetical protein